MGDIYMQVRSPELLRLHREAQARRERMQPPAYAPARSVDPVQAAALAAGPAPRGEPVLHVAAWHHHAWQAARLAACAPEARVLVRDVMIVVAGHFGLAAEDLSGPRRLGHMVKARQIGMHLAHRLTGRSMPEIGRVFGGRDHTTVWYAIRKIEAQAEADPALAATLADISAQVLG